MRALVAYAFAVTVVAIVLGLQLVNERRINAERQLAPVTSTAPIARAATAARSPRTFTASSGYVLSADDLDRIDADHTAEKAAAELEYYVKTRNHRR